MTAFNSVAQIKAELNRRKQVDIRRELSRMNYLYFIRQMNAGYVVKPVHESVGGYLNRFAKGEIKRLMITTQPQIGKSELSTRNFVPYLFGRNPTLKIGLGSYAASKAHKFSREIQQRFDSDEYSKIFPGVRLPGQTSADKGKIRTHGEFDVLSDNPKPGNFKAVGRKGGITGDPIDIFILDDLVKDYAEAKSPDVMEGAWEWIVGSIETRIHNDSQILYVTTRWGEDDPAARFLERDGLYNAKTNPNGWVYLNFPAIQTKGNAGSSYDVRKVGEVLWPEKHSKERLVAIQKQSPVFFDALYQGDPKPSNVVRILPNWQKIDEFPDTLNDLFIGLDFGFSNDPTAAILIGIYGNRIYLKELFYQTRLTNPDILTNLRTVDTLLLPIDDIDVICDKAEPKSIEELQQGCYRELNGTPVWIAGVNAMACEKGPGSIVAGLLLFDEYEVYYTTDSTNIDFEVKHYSWKVLGGKVTNVPIDKHNHAIDAIRSALFTRKHIPQGNTQQRRNEGYKGRSY